MKWRPFDKAPKNPLDTPNGRRVLPPVMREIINSKGADAHGSREPYPADTLGNNPNLQTAWARGGKLEHDLLTYARGIAMQHNSVSGDDRKKVEDAVARINASLRGKITPLTWKDFYN
jgi:hypothetical protein